MCHFFLSIVFCSKQVPIIWYTPIYWYSSCQLSVFPLLSQGPKLDWQEDTSRYIYLNVYLSLCFISVADCADYQRGRQLWICWFGGRRSVLQHPHCDSLWWRTEGGRKVIEHKEQFIGVIVKVQLFQIVKLIVWLNSKQYILISFLDSYVQFIYYYYSHLGSWLAAVIHICQLSFTLLTWLAGSVVG